MSAALQAKRVLFVNTAFAPDFLGGAELSIKELVCDLQAEGIQVLVVCLGEANSNDLVEGVKVTRINYQTYKALTKEKRTFFHKAIWHISELFRFSAYFKLRNIIREFDPDLVHFHNLAGFGWMSWLAAYGRPSIQVCHDYSLICTSATGMHHDIECNRSSLTCRATRWMYTNPALRPSVVVGVSKYVATRMQLAGVVGSKSSNTVIYNAPNLVSGTGFTSRGNPIFGFIGRISPEKGLEVVLEGFRSAGLVDSRILIAGTGEESYLEKIRMEYGDLISSEKVTFLGQVRPELFYRQVSVVLVPSQWQEPFGRVAAEALLSGSGVIYSRAGGLPEVVELYGGSSIEVADFRSSDSWAVAMQAAVDGDWDISQAVRAPRSSPKAEYLKIYDSLLNAGFRRDI